MRSSSRLTWAVKSRVRAELHVMASDGRGDGRGADALSLCSRYSTIYPLQPTDFSRPQRSWLTRCVGLSWGLVVGRCSCLKRLTCETHGLAEAVGAGAAECCMCARSSARSWRAS
eukprot:3940239-Rhodomonas_salina.2